MKIITVFLAGASALAAGCSTTPIRGQIFSSDSNDTVKIHMGHMELKKGDVVLFFSKRCSIPTRGHIENCAVKEVGAGKVAERLDEHDLLVTISSGSPLPTGTYAERADEINENHKH